MNENFSQMLNHLWEFVSSPLILLILPAAFKWLKKSTKKEIKEAVEKIIDDRITEQRGTIYKSIYQDIYDNVYNNVSSDVKNLVDKDIKPGLYTEIVEKSKLDLEKNTKKIVSDELESKTEKEIIKKVSDVSEKTATDISKKISVNAYADLQINISDIYKEMKNELNNVESSISSIRADISVMNSSLSEHLVQYNDYVEFNNKYVEHNFNVNNSIAKSTQHKLDEYRTKTFETYNSVLSITKDITQMSEDIKSIEKSLNTKINNVNSNISTINKLIENDENAQRESNVKIRDIDRTLKCIEETVEKLSRYINSDIKPLVEYELPKWKENISFVVSHAVYDRLHQSMRFFINKGSVPETEKKNISTIYNDIEQLQMLPMNDIDVLRNLYNQFDNLPQ